MSIGDVLDDSFKSDDSSSQVVENASWDEPSSPGETKEYTTLMPASSATGETILPKLDEVDITYLIAVLQVHHLSTFEPDTFVVF